MVKEFIAETKSGSLYYVTYASHFFEHGSRFSCEQLVGRTINVGRKNEKVTAFNVKDKIIGSQNLNLRHFKPGIMIITERYRTSPVVKIFERIM